MNPNTPPLIIDPTARPITKNEVRKYGGMRPRDIPIWRQHLITFARAYGTVLYGTRLGGRDDVPPWVTGAHQEMWRLVQAKRPDAIAIDHMGQVNVIEVKPRATFAAIGQVTGYVYLLRKELRRKKTTHADGTKEKQTLHGIEPKMGHQVQAVIICAYSDADTRDYAQAMGVMIIEYPSLAPMYQVIGSEDAFIYPQTVARSI